MTQTEQIVTILLMAMGVMATRFIPFLLFPSAAHTPRFVRYLGRFLASAVFGMLVVYCIKDVPLLTGRHGWPEFLGIAVTAALHVWRRNMLVSIAGGTIFYMVLLNVLMN